MGFWGSARKAPVVRRVCPKDQHESECTANQPVRRGSQPLCEEDDLRRMVNCHPPNDDGKQRVCEEMRKDPAEGYAGGYRDNVVEPVARLRRAYTDT